MVCFQSNFGDTNLEKKNLHLLWHKQKLKFGIKLQGRGIKWLEFENRKISLFPSPKPIHLGIRHIHTYIHTHTHTCTHTHTSLHMVFYSYSGADLYLVILDYVASCKNTLWKILTSHHITIFLKMSS